MQWRHHWETKQKKQRKKEWNDQYFAIHTPTLVHLQRCNMYIWHGFRFCMSLEMQEKLSKMFVAKISIFASLLVCCFVLFDTRRRHRFFIVFRYSNSFFVFVFYQGRIIASAGSGVSNTSTKPLKMRLTGHFLFGGEHQTNWEKVAEKIDRETFSFFGPRKPKRSSGSCQHFHAPGSKSYRSIYYNPPPQTKNNEATCFAKQCERRYFFIRRRSWAKNSLRALF